jgi:7-alpha-hydroxysteroid dehydrogenase
MILDRFKLTDRADVVCAARTEADLEQTAERVRATGRRALPVRTDVLERGDVEHLVAAATAEFGKVDILVNNAGGWPPQPALRTGADAFRKALDFNVVAPFLLTRLLVPVMVETAGGGAIVNISSRAASMVQPMFVAYGASKAGLSFMTRNLAPELAPKVRINAIEVGGVETDALASVLLDDAVRTQMEDNTPMRRVGQVEDIAAGVVYLVSDASSWVTGKIFEIDGGVEHPSFTIPFEPL